MVWEGENVIATARQMMGKTNPQEALPGTIRGDFGLTVGKILFTVLTQKRAQRAKFNYFSKKKSSFLTAN